MIRQLSFGRAFSALVIAVGLVGQSAVGQQAGLPQVQHMADGTVVVNGGELVFDSWGDYIASEFFRSNPPNCATPNAFEEEPALGGGSGDCTFNLTNPDEIYDPSVILYRIPVVVHVIRDSSGVQGNVSEEKVHQQIQMLNEDFLALLGSPGENGTDVQIEFFLATVAPNGAPTSGITYSNNTTWFNDGGSYWNSLAWDTNRYLNIYTNFIAPGVFGYVPNFPQAGIAGSAADRVVVKFSSFGLSNVATHEVGHYFGLYHTFQGSCGTASCYTTGDLICDTNPQFGPTWSCFTSSCGNENPYDNYMDYSDDFCQTGFTPDQARRMRCSLEFYRPNVYIVAPAVCGNGDLEYGEGCDDGNGESGDGCSGGCLAEVNFAAATTCADHGAAGQICTVIPPCGIESRISTTSRFRLAMFGPTVGAEATAECGDGPIPASTIINGNPIVVEFDPPLPDGSSCTITLGGGAFGSFQVRRLAGDVNGDGSVTFDDVTAVKAVLGSPVTMTTARYDVDANGYLNGADLTAIKPRIGGVAATCP